MMNDCENYYKTCRKNAGLTQDEASELLFISSRTLSAYENDEIVPSDGVVDLMARHYKTPLLAWWHVKYQTPLGKYFPDVMPPSNECDMAFQSVLMASDLDKANEIIKNLLADGAISDDEMDEFENYKSLIKLVTDRGASIGTYRKE